MDQRCLSADARSPNDDPLASTAAARAGRIVQGPDRVAPWLPLGGPPVDWLIPSPAWHPVPAHDGDAEHVWKDGDSWCGAGGDDAIVDALTRDNVGDTDDRGGVSGTQPVALCAIMEGAITGES